MGYDNAVFPLRDETRKIERELMMLAGWTRFMEWQYPVRIEITSRRTFRAAGMLEAAATL